MNHEEKAKELVEKFKPLVDNTRVNDFDNQPEINAKQCALLCCDEILNHYQTIGHCSTEWDINFWQQVKASITNL